MTRDWISDDRLLSLHPFFEGEGRDLLEIKMTRHATSTLTHVKKSHLRSFLLGLDLFLIGTHLRYRCEERCTISESIECSRVDEGLERFLIDHITPRSLDEVIERYESSSLDSISYRLDRPLPKSLDCLESESDMPIIDEGELSLGLIHIGREDFDFLRTSFLDLEAYSIRIFGIRDHECSHGFRRIIGLHVGRLIGNHRIAGCMRLIESISREWLNNLIEYIDRKSFSMSLYLGSFDEFPSLFHEEFIFLLPDGTPEDIRFSEGESGKCLYELHDLFLIDCNPIRGLQDLLE